MIRPVFFIFVFSLTAFSAWAESPTKLDSIIIQEEDGSRSRTIKRSTLEHRQVEDLKDVFRQEADVTVGGGSQRTAQKVYVRGVEDTQLNVSVDGARQSGYLFHHQGRLSIDPELLKAVEVDAGTGDALSGPAALAGALRFETKDVEDLLIPGQSYGLFLKERFHSATEEKGLSLGLFSQATRSIGVLFYGNLANTQDYSAGGDTNVPFTAAKPRSGLAKITVRPTENQKLALATHYRSDNARRLLRANFGLTSNNSTPTDQEFGNFSNSLSYDWASGNPYLNLHATTYFADTWMSQLNNGVTNDAKWRAWGGELRNSIDLDDFELTTGADFNQDQAESIRSAGSQEETGQILGLYTQATYSLTPRFILGGGLRFDHYSLETVDQSTLSHSRLNPNLRTAYQWNSRFSTFVSWSQAYRGATPMEAYVFGNAVGVAPVPELSGTVANTTEAGFKQKLGKSGTFGVVGYWTKLMRPIHASMNRTTSLIERKNTDDITVRGINFSADYQWKLFKTRASYAHNVAEFGDEPLGYVAFNRGAAFGDRLLFGVDYLPSSQLIFSWDSLFAFRLKDVPQGQVEQPGYGIHDLSMSWIPNLNWRVGVAVHNLFDRLYVAQGTVYTVGGGVNPLYEPGRDFRISVSTRL